MSPRRHADPDAAGDDPTPVDDAAALAAAVRSGALRPLARLLRQVDDDDPRAGPVVDLLWRHGGRASVVGVTGPPGAGKSTLVSALVQVWRQRQLRVAVLAVDPSSPFTGGALLGDRVRMMAHAEDPDVYVRSLATRGALGGLAPNTLDQVAVLDAAGFDVVLVETVGVGQDEVDIVQAAHTTVVVAVPGLGDAVQAMKAGVLEIADVFVVNKADRPGAAETAADLRRLGRLAPRADGWRVPVLSTVASRGQGAEEVVDAVDRHRAAHTPDRGAARARFAVIQAARRRHDAQVAAWLRSDAGRSALVAVEARSCSPGQVADALTDAKATNELP